MSSGKKSVASAIKYTLKYSDEEVSEIVDAENPATRLVQLKVTEMKDIIRHLKNQGFEGEALSVTANKPQLVQMLVASIRFNNSIQSPQINGDPPQPASLPRVNVISNGNNSKHKPHVVNHHTPNLQVPNKTYSGAKKAMHPLQQQYRQLNSSRKIEAFNTLKVQAGVSIAEILEELDQLGPSHEVDEDAILFNIVAKRTVRGVSTTLPQYMYFKVLHFT